MAGLFKRSCYHNLLFKTNRFVIYILYFLFLFLIGFVFLKALKPRTDSFTPRDLDLFFTSVSAATASSMSAVEMEVFSNAQLIVITVLMFVGGEVFTSMAMLHLNASRRKAKVELVRTDSRSRYNLEQIELGAKVPEHSGTIQVSDSIIRFLGFVVLAYLLVVQIIGVGSVLIYLSLVSSAEMVLKKKGIKTFTFAVFTIVSTFASCGYIPTNENMAIFSKNSGLLLIIIPQVLLGNTLFPPALRLLLWILGRRFKKAKANELLKTSSEEIGFFHLLPRLHSLLLVATVLGFILIGFTLFAALDWNTDGLHGLSTYQKVVGIVFQCTNARHSGESIVDLATISPAILVFFVVMMYLPPYTSFLPVGNNEQIGQHKKKNRLVQNIVFSQLSYLVIFIVLICITERKSLKHDPINFNVLNITLEVISAYGNVGFSTGYSCDRKLSLDPTCVNKTFGFSGKWSDGGKILLILVMFFGRLKQFNMDGGRAWKLL